MTTATLPMENVDHDHNGNPEPGRITDAQAAQRFALAGHAIFTLVSTKTGNRHTYKITQCEDNPELYFVSHLRGPDNTGDYAYMGIIKTDSRMVYHAGCPDGMRQIGIIGNLRPTKKSRIGEDTPCWRAFAWAWDQLRTGTIPATLEIWHAGRCGRCGRLLTDPTSVAAGYGPICREALGI